MMEISRPPTTVLRMRHTTTIALLLTLLFSGACSTDAETSTQNDGVVKDGVMPDGEATPSASANAETVRYQAMCGCSIEGIGRCGNYVMIDGRYVPIVHSSLGKMEWCRKKFAGATIEAAGEMQDGKFIATSVETIE